MTSGLQHGKQQFQCSTPRTRPSAQHAVSLRTNCPMLSACLSNDFVLRIALPDRTSGFQSGTNPVVIARPQSRQDHAEPVRISPLDFQKELEIKRQRRKHYENCLYQMMIEGICFYCGENAYHTDTNIPAALFATVFKVARKNGVVPDLPICQSCKRIGGRKAFRTPQQKRGYIQRAMRRRDGKYLDVPAWTEKEIAELGYSLQMMVKQGISRKLQLKRRLAWPRLRPKAGKVPDGNT